MSNWYGMNNFLAVADYHKSKFADTDQIPVLFAGDFNAIPHTDGGNSLASKHLLDAGFSDGYRMSYPDVTNHAGATHVSDRRIDQIYFKGTGLNHVSTTVRSTWPSVTV